jgi:tryptophanyl-tRNA synthetase
MFSNRVLSGMRPTGALHLGHYHGVLKNWIRLQHEFECLYFVADWHALTTHYETPEIVEQNVWDMAIDWLAAGVDPAQAILFIQSHVPEHAELHLLLSMIAPVSWLERVPSYKDQQQKLSDKDLSTYGFLGYPLLQSADVLIYRASQVPVGEDQGTAHRVHARDCPAVQPCLRARQGIRGKSGGCDKETGGQARASLSAVADAVPGERRR